MSHSPNQSPAAKESAGTGPGSARECDVLIAGGGVAGLAAGRLLAQTGLRVVCVEPEPFPRQRVGESLDWSAPALLADLGIQADSLIAQGLATPKRELRGVAADAPRMTGRPPGWVRKWPLRFELRTVHVDRPQFDQALYEAAWEAGVEFHWDRLDSVRLVDDRVVDGLTKSGVRFSCRWFLDATGRARVMARAAGIDRKSYGVARIALWFQVSAPMEAEATTLYLDHQAGQLSWVWEIPIERNRTSIGVVMPTERFRSLRGVGLTPTEIVSRVLSDFPHFQGLRDSDVGRIESRAFRSYVSDRTAGANWLMIGEAAAFIDPLTSLGVTAAMRTAAEAASVICAYQTNGSRRYRGLEDYDRRVRALADLYNTAINTLLYEPALRNSVGLRWAARSYVVLGYLTNSLYAKIFRPSRVGTRRVLALLAAFRAWMRMWRTVGTLTQQRTQAPSSRSESVS